MLDPASASFMFYVTGRPRLPKILEVASPRVPVRIFRIKGTEQFFPCRRLAPVFLEVLYDVLDVCLAKVDSDRVSA